MNKPTVGIVVLTYNSSKYIIELLESINKQTFDITEIIISDDASNDDTIKLCKEWMQKNSFRFKNVKILNSEKNRGVVNNINKGIKNCSCEWIKAIAGDDILDEQCIEKNIKFIANNKKCEIVFSNMQSFINIFEKNNYFWKAPLIKKIFFKNQKKFLKRLCEENFLPAPTAFYKKSLIEKVGYYDELYPMIEDYPMWLKLAFSGEKFYFFDEVTVFYRIHNKSLSNQNKGIVNDKMFEFRKKIYTLYIKDRIKNPIFHYCEKLETLKNENILKNGNKKITFITYFFNLINPRKYKRLFEKMERIL